MPRLLRRTPVRKTARRRNRSTACRASVSRAQDHDPAACPDDEPGSRGVLVCFARHQAGATPDDAPYEPGGVLSILISPCLVHGTTGGGASPSVALQQTAGPPSLSSGSASSDGG